MKTQNKYKSVLAGIIVFALMLSFAFLVNAAPKIETNAQASIKIEYNHNKSPLNNAKFKIYRVADVSQNFEFSLSGDFKDYNVKINGLDTAGYAAAAKTLETYAIAHDISPFFSGKTQNGTLKFDNLKIGLYLVVGEKALIGDNQYTAIPTLVSLPNLDSNNNPIYDVILNSKFDVSPKPDDKDPKHQSLRVIKVWNDYSDFDNKRPNKVEVQLIGDGNVFDTIELNEANSWSYTWKNLETDIDWLIIEKKVPQFYTVVYTSDKTEGGLIFRVQNTYDNGEEPPTPTDPSEPTKDYTDDGTISDTIPDAKPPTTGKDHTKPPYDGTDKPKLPQTGQLWWPVPLSAAFGLLLFSLGWFMVFRKKRYEEK